MAALETRGAIAARGDSYLTPLPLTGTTKDDLTATWVEEALSGTRRAELVPIRVGDDQLGIDACCEVRRFVAFERFPSELSTLSHDSMTSGTWQARPVRCVECARERIELRLRRSAA